jgi:magnesium-transporting ATPase (P-type)
MFKIYQENKEVVCCLGNIMNSANLKSFMQANVSIGMMIEPSYRCRRCNGRITLEQKNSQDVKNNKMVEKQNINLNEPSILEMLSSQLTALACDFVFKANTNVYCIYPALRESRRLIEGIRHVVIMCSVCYGTIFMSYFISEVIIGINSKSLPLLTKY